MCELHARASCRTRRFRGSHRATTRGSPRRNTTADRERFHYSSSTQTDQPSPREIPRFRSWPCCTFMASARGFLNRGFVALMKGVENIAVHLQKAVREADEVEQASYSNEHKPTKAMDLRGFYIIAAALIVCCIILVWGFRWDIEGVGEARAYKLNRLTGSVVAVYGTREMSVRPESTE